HVLPPDLLVQPSERCALPNRIPRGGAESLELIRQFRQAFAGMSPNFFSRGRRRQALSAAHHRLQQREGARYAFIGAANHVMMIISILREPEDLLASGRVGFLLAEFGLVFHATILFNLHQLIDHVQRRNIARGRQFSPHAEEINWRALSDEFRNLEFIQVATGYNFGLLKAMTIQDATHPSAL